MYKFWAIIVIKWNPPKYSKIEEWLKIMYIQINVLQSMIYIYLCVYLFIEEDILNILINEKKSSVKQYE